jgi:hypothetical protein
MKIIRKPHTLTLPVSKTPVINTQPEEGNRIHCLTDVVLCKKRTTIMQEDQINTLNRFVTPLSKKIIYIIFARSEACRRFQSCHRKQTSWLVGKRPLWNYNIYCSGILISNHTLFCARNRPTIHPASNENGIILERSYFHTCTAEL